MTGPSAIDSSRLTVLLDVRHPLAYLALGPAVRLERELGLDINWLPLVCQPLKAPAEPRSDDDRGRRHRRFRALAIAREIETHADTQGLVVRDFYRAPDPRALNLAWLWIRAHAPSLLEPFLFEAFRAYWALELDPGDLAAVRSLVEAMGGDGATCAAWCVSTSDGMATAAALEAELRERGLHAVPTYLVEDEVFLGRQHWPMIRWILQGRPGHGPI